MAREAARSAITTPPISASAVKAENDKLVIKLLRLHSYSVMWRMRMPKNQSVKMNGIGAPTSYFSPSNC